MLKQRIADVARGCRAVGTAAATAGLGMLVGACLGDADYTDRPGESFQAQLTLPAASGVGAPAPGAINTNGTSGNATPAGNDSRMAAVNPSAADPGAGQGTPVGSNMASPGAATPSSIDTTQQNPALVPAAGNATATEASGASEAPEAPTDDSRAANGAAADPGVDLPSTEGDGAFEGDVAIPQEPEPMVPSYDCTGALTLCENGFAGEKACSGINELAYMPGPSLQGGDGNDIWGWTDPMTGKEYALVGLSNGTAFVDVSDPCHPVHLGHLRTQTVNELWRDVKVYKNYAYIVAESQGHGLQVFDLTQLRNVANPPVALQPTTVLDSFGSAHNIAINVDTGFAYPQSCNNCPDARSIDLSDPANPVDLGCWGSRSRTHDAMCFNYNGPDQAFAGKEICLTGSEERGFFVYDVSNKADVPVVSQTRYPNLSYAHQVWVTEDHHYAILSDEADELDSRINMTLNIFDLSDLTAPLHIGQYVSPLGNTDHQLFVRGKYAFLSAYSAGLRVLDLSNIAQGELVEVGYFDTYPQHDNAGFDGQWSVYPYFESGILVTNGLVMGLHVLQPNPEWMQPGSQWMGW